MLKKSLRIVLAFVLLFTGVQAVQAETEINVMSSFKDDMTYVAVSQYKGYMYSISKQGLTVVDATDPKNPVDRTDRTNPDITGTVNTSMEPNNTYTYVYGDYLYALVTDQKQLRRFSLSDPSAPILSRVYQMNGTGTMYYMAISGSYAYIATEGNFLSVNLQTGAARSINGTSYRVLRIHGGYLFGGGYNGLDIYDLSGDLSAPNRIYSNNLQFGSGEQRVIMDFGFSGDYCLFTTYLAKDWMKRNIWYLDISDMRNLDGQEFGKFAAGDTMSRVNTIAVKNGLMLVSDIDNLIHIFDVSSMPDLVRLGTADISGNPYNMVIDGQYIYLSTFSGALTVCEAVADNLALEDEYVSAKNPIVISGKAPGSSTVTVSLAGVDKAAEVDDEGRFAAEFDDEFIENGAYTVSAAVYHGDRILVSKSASVTVAHPPRLVIEDEQGIQYNDGSASHSISLQNNIDTQIIHFITAAYQGDMMTGYRADSQTVAAGSRTSFQNQFANESPDTICSYLIRESEGKYTLLWESTVYGSPLPAGTAGLQKGSEAEVNITHETRQVAFGFRSENNGGAGAVLVFKPGAQDVGTGLEYIGKITVDEEGIAAADFTLMTPAVENEEYTIQASMPEKGVYKYITKTFKYYGEETLRPILEQIKNSTAATIETVLNQNADKLSIDMSQDSAYASLHTQYKTAVLEQFAGCDYLAKGSLQFKIDFNHAVKEQQERQAYDDACAAALTAVNAADSAKALEEAFDQHSVLRIDKAKTGFWAVLELSAQDKTVQRFKNKRPYTKMEDVYKDYMIFTALEYINQTPYDQLGGVIEKTRQTLALSLPEKFTQFSDRNKQYVYKEVSRGADYSDAKTLQNAIDEAAEYVYNKYVKGSGGGNGSSNGGGGAVYPILPQPTVPPSPTVQPGQPSVEKPVFSDLDQVEWAQDAILSLAEAGIIHGRGDGIFAPDAYVSKEEFVKMAVSAFEIAMDVPEELPFFDVDAEAWSRPYISAAFHAGIISGVSEDSFAPETNISRQDMCVILYNILKKEHDMQNQKDIMQFTDYNEISEYSRQAVSALYSAGLANGIGDGCFAPRAYSTRAMAAKLIWECIGYRKGE